ncbi:hypothetical protein ACQP2X_28055 [Actinoplanes sp. CA-131856]
MFTSEGHEYWGFLAGDRAQLLRLYRELVGPQVREDDLYFDTDIAFSEQPGGPLRLYQRQGAYNPHNVWNTSLGLAHLTHPENSLYGEISLAAAASVPRATGEGTPIPRLPARPPAPPGCPVPPRRPRKGPPERPA